MKNQDFNFDKSEEAAWNIVHSIQQFTILGYDDNLETRPPDKHHMNMRVVEYSEVSRHSS